MLDILEWYKKMYCSNGGSEITVQSYTTQNLSKMLRTEFQETELYIKADSTKKMIVFKANSLTIEEAYEKLRFSSGGNKSLIWECAMKMRQDILQIETTQLEEPLTVDSIMDREAQVPNTVKEFFTTLYTGSSSDVGLSKRKQWLIDSTSADVLYGASGGKILPGKHLSLGLALKSMTGSKTVTN